MNNEHSFCIHQKPPWYTFEYSLLYSCRALHFGFMIAKLCQAQKRKTAADGKRLKERVLGVNELIKILNICVLSWSFYPPNMITNTTAKMWERVRLYLLLLSLWLYIRDKTLRCRQISYAALLEHHCQE